MKDGITEKYGNCKECGAKCNGDDDGFDLCRFCGNSVPCDDNESEAGENIERVK